MRAGRLRHRIHIQRATITANDYGEPAQAWATIATVWAGVEPLRGREYFAASQVQGAAEVRIIIRYGPQVASLNIADRVLHGSTVYDINSVQNIDSRNKELHIMAKVHL